MAYHIPDNDNEENEALRVQKALCMFLKPVVAGLKALMLDRVERGFISQMDTVLCTGNAPSDADVRRIKEMAWKYRRSLPKHQAPVLPPHDPIVQEMERNHG